MTPEETLELLREAHREPIGEAHYAAVRARVMEKIAAGQRRAAWRIWGLAFAAFAACALSLAFWPKAPRPAAARRSVESRTVYSGAAENGATPASLRAPASPRRAARKGGGRPKGLAPQVVGPSLSRPLVVKMVTDDPNVVIYWLAEGTGE
jgi:hypothetical protein